MSVTARALPAALEGRSQFVSRLALSVAAIAVVAAGVALLTWLLAPAAAPPPRNPFGVGVREAAPSAGGLGGFILALQGQFYRTLQAGVAALKENGAAIWSLLAVGFAYGVFHAAGPGHGKAVIAAYIVSDQRALAKAVGMSLAAALVQAIVAVALVSIVAALLRASGATMSEVTNTVEIVSFGAVCVLELSSSGARRGSFSPRLLCTITRTLIPIGTTTHMRVIAAADMCLSKRRTWREAGRRWPASWWRPASGPAPELSSCSSSPCLKACSRPVLPLPSQWPWAPL